MIRYTQNLRRVGERERQELPLVEAPPTQPAPTGEAKPSRLYRKKELVTEGAKKGPLKRGLLPISRATFDRWRELYPDFALNYNPNPDGWGLYDLDEILQWMQRNGRNK